MADKYLYHLGNNTAPYESAATAATSLNALLAGTTVAVGETIWVHKSHVDQNDVNQSYTSPAAATPSTPQRLYCVDNFTDMNLDVGAIIRPTAGARSRTFNGNWHLYGINYGTASIRASDGTLTAGTSGSNCFAENCEFYTGSGSGSSHVFGASTSTGIIRVHGGTFLPRNTTATLELFSSKKYIENLVVDDNNSIPTNLFTAGTLATGETEVMNCDFSDLAVTSLVLVSANATQIIKFINCRLPSGAAITDRTTGWTTVGSCVYLINCDSGNTNYRWELHVYHGIITLDTLVYATTDPALYEDDLEYSLKMSANANASRYLPLQSEWVHKWFDAGEHTLDVECLVGEDDAAALTTDELYLEVDYISGASSPLGSRSTTAPDILTTGGNVTAGTTAWTGDTYTTERTHKLSATVTSSKNGYIRYRVCLAKPSTIVYFNPV